MRTGRQSMLARRSSWTTVSATAGLSSRIRMRSRCRSFIGARSAWRLAGTASGCHAPERPVSAVPSGGGTRGAVDLADLAYIVKHSPGEVESLEPRGSATRILPRFLARLCRPPAEGHRLHIEVGIDDARGPRIIGEGTDGRTGAPGCTPAGVGDRWRAGR